MLAAWPAALAKCTLLRPSLFAVFSMAAEGDRKRAVMLQTLIAFLISCLCCTRALEDVCTGAGVRPVLLVPGFLGSPLYNSAKDYKIEWPDVDTFGQKYGPGETDLDLPMRWSGLEQAMSTVGPERNAQDDMPSLDGLFGNLFEFTVRCKRMHAACMPQ